MEKVLFTVPDTGENVEFTVEAQTTLNGCNYLLVSEETDDDDALAYILKEIVIGENDSVYEMVEDDKEVEALAPIFSELIDEDTDLAY